MALNAMKARRLRVRKGTVTWPGSVQDVSERERGACCAEEADKEGPLASERSERTGVGCCWAGSRDSLAGLLAQVGLGVF